MAGIFDRISTLMRANINALLDSAEDPEQTIDQIIRDMRSAIDDARGQVAEMIARERLLQRDIDENRSMADEWDRKAALAVSRNADDLAREALRRKLDYQKTVGLLEPQWQAQHEVVEKLKSDLSSLENRYQQATQQRDQLIARHKAAQAMQQVNQTMSKYSTYDPSSELKRMEERIALQEARAQAGVEMREVSLEDQFAKLDQHDDVETELALLKQQVSGQLPEPKSGEDKPS